MTQAKLITLQNDAAAAERIAAETAHREDARAIESERLIKRIVKAKSAVDKSSTDYASGVLEYFREEFGTIVQLASAIGEDENTVADYLSHGMIIERCAEHGVTAPKSVSASRKLVAQLTGKHLNKLEDERMDTRVLYWGELLAAGEPNTAKTAGRVVADTENGIESIEDAEACEADAAEEATSEKTNREKVAELTARLMKAIRAEDDDDERRELIKIVRGSFTIANVENGDD